MVKRVFGKVDGIEVNYDHSKGDWWNVPVPLDIDGEYVIEVIAEDEAGNQSFITRLLYTVNINSGYVYSIACGVIGGKMQDYFLESLKLQRIDFFLKLVAASECSDEEKGLALQWVSELTDELMAKIRTHEYNRSMDVIS